MTGEVTHRPGEKPHRCAPGVTFSPITDGPLAGLRTVNPPTASTYPPGTVWTCRCSREWRSTKRGVPAHAPGVIRWERHQPVRWWCVQHPVARWLLLSALVLIGAVALTAAGVLR